MNNTFTPQPPALGIMLQQDWGDAKTYNIECDCTDPDHSHTLDVESDEDFGVSVTIWTTVETPIWSISRWKLIWQLLTKGTVKYNAALILQEQQAINYAAALNKAIVDVKTYKRTT